MSSGAPTPSPAPTPTPGLTVPGAFPGSVARSPAMTPSPAPGFYTPREARSNSSLAAFAPLRHAGPSRQSLRTSHSDGSSVTLESERAAPGPADRRRRSTLGAREEELGRKATSATMRTTATRQSRSSRRELEDAMALARQETGGFSGTPDRVGRSPIPFRKGDKEGAGRGYPGSGTREDPYVVSFDPEEDKEDPMKFGKARKWFIIAITAFSTLCVSYSSSAFSGAFIPMMAYFDASSEVITAGLSLFVLGFALGPLLWAPMSEMFGRKILFVMTYGPFAVFHIGCALSTNLPTLLVCRFLAGTFGSSPLTNSGGVVSDLFSAYDRGLAMSVFALAPFAGPVLGPVVGGFVGETIGWRAEFWIMFGFSGVMFILNVLFVPESYAPVLLRWRAEKLQREANGPHGKLCSHPDHPRIYFMSVYDVTRPQTESFARRMRTSLLKPFVLLFRELICALMAIYAALVYGTLYLMFEAFPIVFAEGHHWSTGISGLAFIGVGVGMLIGVALNVRFNARYMAQLDASPTGYIPPEARLPASMLGGVLLPIGLFWFAWTTYPSIHWAVPIVASAPFGAGMVLVFLSMMSYLVDAYVIYAASSLAANSVLRSLLGAAFPLFAKQMYDRLGTQWASCLVAFLSLACAPIPFAFYYYGGRIRARSKFAADPIQPSAATDEEKGGTDGDEIEELAEIREREREDVEAEMERRKSVEARRSLEAVGEDEKEGV